MIPITRPELPAIADYQALLEEIWQSRMLSNFGPFAQRLERLTSDYLGVPTKVVASGDVGLMIAIAALDLTAGSTVVMPSFTFNSTANAVLWNGLRPVFADIDPVTFNLDPAAAEDAASRFDARLILATHVFGNPADVDGLAQAADRTGARLLFDAAHAYGARRDGRAVGSFGDAEIFSLSGTKLVTSGEGGLIASADASLLERITYLRGYGFQGDYNSRYVGINGKMSELHAALGTLTLARVEDAISVRQHKAGRYAARLEGSGVQLQAIRASDRSTFKDFALLFDSGEVRDDAEASLTRAGVQTKRYFLPCHTQVAYREYPRGPMGATESVYGRILCVPLFESMTDAELEAVIDGILTATA
jgi:dTDP-4-amino-4,6-dideoxygalactose transaminase